MASILGVGILIVSLVLIVTCWKCLCNHKTTPDHGGQGLGDLKAFGNKEKNNTGGGMADVDV